MDKHDYASKLILPTISKITSNHVRPKYYKIMHQQTTLARQIGHASQSSFNPWTARY